MPCGAGRTRVRGSAYVAPPSGGGRAVDRPALSWAPWRPTNGPGSGPVTCCSPSRWRCSRRRGPAAPGQDQPQAAPLDAWTYVLTTLAAAALVLWRRRPLAGLRGHERGRRRLPRPRLSLRPDPVHGGGGRRAAGRVGAAAHRGDRRGWRTPSCSSRSSWCATSCARWPEALTHVLGVLVWTALPLAIGVAVRTRREAAARVREEQALRAVADERLRDGAGAARRRRARPGGHRHAGRGRAARARPGPGQGPRAALEAIRTASRDALDGLRAEVVALRGGAPARARAGAGRPRPELVDRVRVGGLRRAPRRR